MMNAANNRMLSLLKAKEANNQFTTIGQDAFNQPIMGWAHPLSGTVSSVNGQPVTGNPSSQGQFAAMNLDPNKPLYGQLDLARQKEVDGMIAGRIAMPTQRLLQTPYYNQMLQAANERAQQMGLPGFDQATWLSSVQGRKDWANGGKDFMAMQGLNQLDQHAEKASNAVENISDNEKLGGNYPALNAVQGWLANNANTNSQLRTSLAEFQNTKSALTDEMSKAWKTGVMSDKEKEDWESKINAADSPQVLRQTLVDFEELVDARRQQLVNGYKSQFGQDYASSPNALDQDNHQRVFALLHQRRDAGLNPQPVQAQPKQNQKPLSSIFGQ